MTSAENQIQADIEALKSRFTNTQELYREVAAVLFFRYGLTPTANKLYQLVRKGSMSAPAEALNRFWANLREKSQVRIEAPDLPDALATQAGELVASLWIQAQAQVQNALATVRQEIEAELVSARSERDDALAAAASIRSELDQARNRISALEKHAMSAELQLAAEVAAKDSLSSQLSAATEAVAGLQNALGEARLHFASELEKTRSLLALAEDRAKEESRRYLLEIDRERGLVTKAQQETNLTKSSALKQQAQDREAIAHLQTQISELRETCGNLQGQLVQLSSQLESTKHELDFARDSLAKATTIPKPLVKRTPATKKQATNPKGPKARS